MRRANASDWERLRDVRLRELATDPHAFLEALEDARTLPDVHWRERATPSETQATFVEERDGSFAAMVSAFVASDPATAYLVSMWVAPELRGTGIAIELVEHVLDWARDHRRVRVVLSVEPGNDRAARLYEKCGFVDPATGRARVRAQPKQPLLRIRAMTLERWHARRKVRAVGQRFGMTLTVTANGSTPRAGATNTPAALAGIARRSHTPSPDRTSPRRRSRRSARRVPTPDIALPGLGVRRPSG